MGRAWLKGTGGWQSGGRMVALGSLQSRGKVHSAWLACNQRSPPPYEPPVTATLEGSTSGNESATSAASHWVSLISVARLFRCIVARGPLSGSPDDPPGVGDWWFESGPGSMNPRGV